MDFGFIAVLFCWRQHTPHGLVSPAEKFVWPDGSWLSISAVLDARTLSRRVLSGAGASSEAGF